MTTVLTDRGEVTLTDARVSGDDLWLPADRLEAVTGWTVKPEGLCQGDVCVPLPRGRETEFVRDGRVNAAALWRHLGRPVVHGDSGEEWVLGDSARDRSAALASLSAPDFTLPDAAGRPHSLSDYRGRKVFLVTWASW